MTASLRTRYDALSHRERRDAIEALTLVLALIAVSMLYALRARGDL